MRFAIHEGRVDPVRYAQVRRMPFADIVELTIAQDAVSEVIRTERSLAAAEAGRDG